MQRLADVKKGAKASRARVLLSLTVFYYCSTAWIWALDPGNRISQYGHTAWRIQDGYFGGLLSAITQTTDGYLWIGTESGLLRFDGVRFVPWSPPMGQQLPSSRIRSLLGARDGSLWIGTYSGLSRWADHKLINLDIHGVIGTILEDRDGAAWLVYGDPHHTPLCRVAERAVRCYEEADGIPDDANGSIIRDAVGNLWIGAQHGVTRWQPGSFSVHDVSPLRKLEGVDGVEAVAVAADGSIVAGMAMPGRGLGLQQLVQGAWKPFEKAGLDGTKLTVATLFVDRQNALWIGTLQQGIYRVYGETVEHFDMSDGLSGNYVRNFYEDRESNLWVVTSKGIDLFHDLPVVTFSTREGLGTEEVESVLASRDGTIWVGGAVSLDAIRPSGVSSLRTGRGLPGSQVGALFEDHAGQLWVGVDQTLSIYRKGSFRQITRADGSPIGEVTSITEDKENNIWAEILHESTKRLVRIRDFKIQEEFPVPQLPAARQVVADLEGNLWLGLNSGDLARVRNGQPEMFHFERTRGTEIEQLMLDSDGSLLGATAEGVVGWKNGRAQILTARNGLPCNGAHGLIDDSHGNLWLNLQCGIVQVARSELEEWWEKPDIVVHPTVFDPYEGAQPGRAFWESAARSGDGRLWFANGSVLQMIDPDHLARNVTPPPVHVEAIIADRKHYHPQEGLRIPPLPRDLEIDYTALSFGVPQKVLFRYRLEGRDSAWQDAGTRRQAFYTNLFPGKYRFRVIACNNSGMWNEAGAFLDFSIAPAYYQTNWFRTLLAGAFLALLWAAYRLRVGQLRRQERKLRDVIETIPTFAWTSLPDGSMDFVNRHWQEYTGLSTENTVGSGWQAAVHPEDLERHREKWLATLATGERFENEVRYRRATDGQYHWFITRAVPLRDARGHILKWYGISTDIEDRKRAEQLQADLAHVNRVSTMGELTASLAHEIKQPIGAAVTNAEACARLLDRDQPDVFEAREAALEMAKDATRAAHIIDRVRSLYRKGSPQMDTVDVSEVIGEMFVILRNEANRHSVNMRTDLAEGLPRVMADRVQLQQVLMNLMLNGIQAMEKTGGLLTIKTQLDQDGSVQISVSDTGVGLPADKAEQIFDAFFTTKPEGSGMGLAISRSIIESHGGRVWVAANSGKGAAFHFTLPTAAQAVQRGSLPRGDTD